MLTPLANGLPDFPWDRISHAGQVARNHPDGIIDLSIGTPVDSTPAVIMRALQEAANAPGYPTAAGSEQLRAAWVAWAGRALAVQIDESEIVPSIGSKEIVAWLPTILGLNQNHTVAIPHLAYPTYAVGAQMAGAKFITYESANDIPEHVSLIWVNSPANPTGEVKSVTELQAIVSRARELGAVVVSDECYIELGWEAQPVSILHPDVIGSSNESVLAIHSLSKRSNLAGYRSGSIMGDRKLIADVLALRKHAGMLLPAPIAAATVAALTDSDHVQAQREVYHNRRTILRQAITEAGFQIDFSQAGLYLWATLGRSGMETVNLLADVGILCAPGDFYGPAGSNHVRMALTATDERIGQISSRLADLRF
ncbi:MAG: succinyldiaminopimelate transaminase [Actinobacteria bacterium]|nr:succinyldiaminopimelate transaminase [Actinomycetota bacterium]